MPVVRGAMTTHATSASSPSSLQADKPGDTVPKEDLQSSKKIEKFDIPLDSLKKMFDKPKVHKTGLRLAPDFKKNMLIAMPGVDESGGLPHSTRLNRLQRRGKTWSVGLALAQC
ncbi:hypothetical protein AAFF_G00045160 [Aldrovandia affinis]|uniref:Uncharacterized protein n=1 Tax=Aldrovandia affinis TaxID=143900 RepID=A0AAD7S480_9TELE|nr:hypothetical protein AAFF_G00045160 [Aldrovandia affinis]